MSSNRFAQSNRNPINPTKTTILQTSKSSLQHNLPSTHYSQIQNAQNFKNANESTQNRQQIGSHSQVMNQYNNHQHKRLNSNQIPKSFRNENNNNSNIFSNQISVNYECHKAPSQPQLFKQHSTSQLLKHSYSKQNSQSSAALQSFYLSSNVKIFIGVDENTLTDSSNASSELNSCVTIGEDGQQIDLNFNMGLYKQYQFYQAFKLNNNQNIINTILNFIMLDSNNQTTTILTYGQKSTGKSQILGSLFEPNTEQQNLIGETLFTLFDSIQEESFTEVYISCYEVFLETLTDLFDETNETFSTENDTTWLKVSTFQQAEQQLKMAFLNRKQIVDENGLSYSQSHLVVNIKVMDQLSENNGKIISFVDLVGFDGNFTQKIMEGSSFNVNDISALQKGEDFISDEKLQEIISDCNDNNLYSLRNLLIAIETENDTNIQAVLDETTLVRVMFSKLLQSNNFYVIGTVSDNSTCFNETLNTLEFCTKFQNALMISNHNNAQSTQYNIQFTQESNILQTEECANGGLPQEISAYLDKSSKIIGQVSRFYNNNNGNSTIQQNSENLIEYIGPLERQRFGGVNGGSTICNNFSKSNISMNSGKMVQYLNKFLNKQQYGNESAFSQNDNQQINFLKSRNNRVIKDNAIKIQQNFTLENSSQMMKSNLNLIQKVKGTGENKMTTVMKAPQSERSTGFATNTQLTHLRKFSQDFITLSNNNINQASNSNINNVKKQILQKPMMESTFSELNFHNNQTNNQTRNDKQIFNLQLENFSKIVENKSKYDSSFLSTFLINGDTPKNQQCTLAINQFKQAKEQVANNVIQRSKSQLNTCQQKNAKKNKLPPKHSQGNKQSTIDQQNAKQQTIAQQFIFSVIKQSLQTFGTQMKDFNDFFLKDKPKIDGCFSCSNQPQMNPAQSNFSDIFKRQKSRFFDIEKVLKEVEQKEIRHQTLSSIRDSQASSHKKNLSINQLPSAQQRTFNDIGKENMPIEMIQSGVNNGDKQMAMNMHSVEYRQKNSDILQRNNSGEGQRFLTRTMNNA